MPVELIKNGQHLVKAEENASVRVPLRIWDDGFGPLWVYREGRGVVGIVRAETFKKAYSAVVDEIMDDADSTEVELEVRMHAREVLESEGLEHPSDQEVSVKQRQLESDEGWLPEGVHFRGNGVPSNEGLNSHLAQEDLNGSSLDPLTIDLMDELELLLVIDDEPTGDDRALRRRGDRRIWWYANAKVTAAHRWSQEPMLEIFQEDTPEKFPLSIALSARSEELTGVVDVPMWWKEWLEGLRLEIRAWQKTFE